VLHGVGDGRKHVAPVALREVRAAAERERIIRIVVEKRPGTTDMSESAANASDGDRLLILRIHRSPARPPRDRIFLLCLRVAHCKGAGARIVETVTACAHIGTAHADRVLVQEIPEHAVVHTAGIAERWLHVPGVAEHGIREILHERAHPELTVPWVVFALVVPIGLIGVDDTEAVDVVTGGRATRW